MAFLDDGACQLTEITPGAGAFIAQLNALFAQLNAQSATFIMVEIGETIPPMSFVSICHEAGGLYGKLVKNQPHIKDRHRCIGFCAAGGNAGTQGRVQMNGVYEGDLGEGLGAIYYAIDNGAADPSPFNNTDYYKKMVVALGLPGSKTLICAMQNCIIEYAG